MEFILNHDLCSGCRACLLACSVANLKAITTAKAALRIEARFPAPGVYRIHVCDQCGRCAEACPEDAIVLENGRYVLHEEDCIGCGECVEACPNEVLRLDPDTDRPILCTGCGECAAICPRDAITVSWDTVKEATA